MAYDIGKIQRIYLGVQGEYGSKPLPFNVAPWLEEFPEGSISIYHLRNGQDQSYPVATVLDSEEKVLYWTPNIVDTQYKGKGLCQFRLTVDGVVKKSRNVPTEVDPALPGTMSEDVPPAIEPYVDTIEQFKLDAQTARNEAEDAQEAAETAQEAAETAQEAAENAQEAAEDAAELASGAADAAAGSASAAAGSASDAAGSAEDAAGSASSASSAASTASSAAESASQSASDAESSKEGADAAKEAALTAQSAAETAKDGAETAQAAAEAAAEEAQSAMSPKMDKHNPTGYGAVNIGTYNTVTSETGMALGSHLTVSTSFSLGTGTDNTVSGFSSFASGAHNTASGYQSTAQGNSTTASGWYSHAVNGWTKASGDCSFAEGSGTIATGQAQHVQGQYNVEDTQNKFADIIGGGTYSAPKNIETVDWSGNMELAGDLAINACGGANPVQVGTTLVSLNQAIGTLPTSETGSEWANKEELNTELVGQFVGEVDRMFSTGLPQESTMGRVITQLALGNGLLNDLYLGMEVS